MQSLTFRLLEVFQSIVDHGSITAASSALSLSQPTVSLQLKKLSGIVGMPLFEQTYGQLKMTEAGEAVYQCAQEVLGSQSRLESQVHALKGVEIGTLKLAVVTTAKYVVPPILSPFCKQHPNIEVRFIVVTVRILSIACATIVMMSIFLVSHRKMTTWFARRLCKTSWLLLLPPTTTGLITVI